MFRLGVLIRTVMIQAFEHGCKYVCFVLTSFSFVQRN